MKHVYVDPSGVTHVWETADEPAPPPSPEQQIAALQDAVDTLTLALLELEP
jgi:hypothetical protein